MRWATCGWSPKCGKIKKKKEELENAHGEPHVATQMWNKKAKNAEVDPTHEKPGSNVEG